MDRAVDRRRESHGSLAEAPACRIGEDVPQAQVGQCRAGSGNGSESLAGHWVLFGRRQVIGGSCRERGNGQIPEGPSPMTRNLIIFLLCRPRIMGLEIGEVRRGMTGDTVADFSGCQFGR